MEQGQPLVLIDSVDLDEVVSERSATLEQLKAALQVAQDNARIAREGSQQRIEAALQGLAVAKSQEAARACHQIRYMRDLCRWRSCSFCDVSAISSQPLASSAQLGPSTFSGRMLPHRASQFHILCQHPRTSPTSGKCSRVIHRREITHLLRLQTIHVCHPKSLQGFRICSRLRFNV